MTCADGIGLLSEGHQMLYGPYIKSLRSWDCSGGLSSTSTATICAFHVQKKAKNLGVYSHKLLDIAIALILHLVEGLVNYLWEATF